MDNICVLNLCNGFILCHPVPSWAPLANPNQIPSINEIPKVPVYDKHNIVDTGQKFFIFLSLFSYASFILSWNIVKED